MNKPPSNLGKRKPDCKHSNPACAQCLKNREANRLHRLKHLGSGVRQPGYIEDAPW